MDWVFRLQNGKLCREEFSQFFGPEMARTRVAALVGAGGKTTLMYALAELCRIRGEKVLVSTTTHIARPRDGSFCDSFDACQDRWARGGWAVWGRDLDNGKLGPLSPEDFALALSADRLLVEADGSRHMPCKVPAAHEPQIPSQAELIIGVLGLSALGKTVGEACFRPEDVGSFLGCGPEHRITPMDLAEIISSERGTRKDVGQRRYLAVLNQRGVPEELEWGEQILRILNSGGIQAILTCLQAPESEVDKR